MEGFSKVVQKKVGRAKELLMENLGMADKTTDEVFEEKVVEFNKLNNDIVKFQKELKHYYQSLESVKIMCKSMMETICEIYQSNWEEYDHIQVKAHILEELWNHRCFKILDYVQLSLTNYLSILSLTTKQISERNKLLIDYDSCRHNFENMENSKKSENKIQTAKEQMEEAKRVYEELNASLVKNMPVLCGGKKMFLVTNLKLLFEIEGNFHRECTKLYMDLNEALGKLMNGNERIEYFSTAIDMTEYSEKIIEFALDATEFDKVVSDSDEADENPHKSDSHSTGSKSSPDAACSSDIKARKVLEDGVLGSILGHQSTTFEEKDDDTQYGGECDVESETKGMREDLKSSLPEVKVKSSDNKNLGLETSEDLHTDLPLDVIYQALVMKRYDCHDEDEISLEIGDIVNVVECEDSKEEGWLLGYNINKGKKGLFPAHCTKRL